MEHSSLSQKHLQVEGSQLQQRRHLQQYLGLVHVSGIDMIFEAVPLRKALAAL